MTAIMKRAEAGGSRDALAWFDAGYLVESYRQASHIYKWDMLTAADRAKWTLRSEPGGVDGYALVLKAIAMAGTNPEMEFAASLDEGRGRSAPSTGVGRWPAPGPGSLLAKNLAH